MADIVKMDAIALLKKDHRTVEDLFALFEGASGDGRKQKLAEQICLNCRSMLRSRRRFFTLPAKARWRRTC